MSAGWWLLWDGILSCWVSRVCSFSLQSRVMVWAEPITGLIGWLMGTPVQVSIHHRALCNYLISGYKSLINIFTDRALFHVPESDIWTLYSFRLCFSFSCWKRILSYLVLCWRKTESLSVDSNTSEWSISESADMNKSRLRAYHIASYHRFNDVSICYLTCWHVWTFTDTHSWTLNIWLPKKKKTIHTKIRSWKVIGVSLLLCV